MKRLSLVLAVLLVFGAASAFAQADLSPTISGSATATIGYDLENGSFGMVNSATADIKVDIVPKSTATTGMADSGWYGWVELKDFQIGFDYDGGAKFITGSAVVDTGADADADGKNEYAVEEAKIANSGLIVTAPSVTARIVSGPMYIQIYALDGFATGKATKVESDKDAKVPVEDNETDLSTDLTDGSGGLTFSYTADMFGVKVFFATETGYDAKDPADNGNFLVGTDLSLNVAPAALALEVVRGIGAQETLGLGVGATIDLGVGALFVGFDGQLPDAGDFAWEVGAALDVTEIDPLTIALDLIYSETLFFDTELDVDVDLSPLTLGLLVGVYDMGTTVAGDEMDYRLTLDAAYDVTDDITASVSAGYDSFGNIPLTVKAVMTPIPQTTFTLQYASGTSLVDATATGGSAQDLGEITFATKIAY